jgi:hypothetical protein
MWQMVEWLVEALNEKAWHFCQAEIFIMWEAPWSIFCPVSPLVLPSVGENH